MLAGYKCVPWPWSAARSLSFATYANRGLSRHARQGEPQRARLDRRVSAACTILARCRTHEISDARSPVYLLRLTQTLTAADSRERSQEVDDGDRFRARRKRETARETANRDATIAARIGSGKRRENPNTTLDHHGDCS